MRRFPYYRSTTVAALRDHRHRAPTRLTPARRATGIAPGHGTVLGNLDHPIGRASADYLTFFEHELVAIVGRRST